MAEPLLEARDIVKSFGRVHALRGASFSVYPQEIVALIGDNGAGKSTLVKTLVGVHPPDSGQIFFEGKPVLIATPHDSRDLGIETVYQDLALFDNLGAVANFYAGREVAGPRWMPRGFRLLRRSVMAAETQRLLERLQVNLPDLDTPVGLMSGGQRQAVAVARAAAFASKVVILDEPTAALGLRESRRVLDLITRLRTEGLAVLVISHALDHVIEVADRAIVMRRGRVVGEAVPSTENRQRIVSLIVGGEG
jgi:D-xylose transport system ATP-binding protein